MKKDLANNIDLPDELLIQIFSYLPLSSIPSASIVQHRWHTLFADRNLCLKFLAREFPQFYANSQDLMKLEQSAHEILKKEYKMKVIISNLVFEKKIPDVLKNDEILWMKLYLRLFNKSINDNYSWYNFFHQELKDMRQIVNKLHIVACSGYVDLLILLIEAIQSNELKPSVKKAPSQRLRSWFSPKATKTSKPQMRITKYINDYNSTLVTPLYIAAQKGYIDIVKTLLFHHADVNKGKSDCGLTPLFIAAVYGHLHIVETLIAHNANVNKARIDNGWTPLFIAAFKGNFEIVKILIRHNADVNKANTTDGETPLFIAAQKRNEEIVEYLIRNGAKDISPELSILFPEIAQYIDEVKAKITEVQNEIIEQHEYANN